MAIASYLPKVAVIAFLGCANVAKCLATEIDYWGIAAHQDQLQNLIVDCRETRKHNTDAVTAAHDPFYAEHPQIDLSRSESFDVKFAFLNGNARYDRETDPETVKYWVTRGLPAIASQIQSITAGGRIEELTTQQLINGKRPSFGGFRQLSQFSPDDTIDVALGLRLLGARQWLSKDDLNAMREIPQPDQGIIDLQATDGTGHTHELRFDRSLLFALIYYRCSNSHGASVEIANSDFHRYDNVFIPGTIVRTSNLPDSSGQIHHPLVYTIIVKNASINDAQNTESRYVITWPANLRLFDARTNDPVEVGPVARSLSDDDIHQQLAEKRVRDLMLWNRAEARIQQALSDQPTTRP
jgi:hypothetical protein